MATSLDRSIWEAKASRDALLQGASEARMNRNDHAQHHHTQHGSTYLLLRGYRNANAGAVGYAAVIEVDESGYAAWRVYHGWSDALSYAEAAIDIKEHGGRMNVWDSRDMAVIKTIFPEIPLALYAR